MYDVIVVGARCAGAPTAMLLARRGHDVLLVDRALFPSDTLSAHYIAPSGVATLERWGLLAPLVESGCPPMTSWYVDDGFEPLFGTPAGNLAALCPRRTVLDKVLVDAAAAAGADVRTGFTVQSLLVHEGRVSGVEGHARNAASITERARLVIGADGRNSPIARWVDAATYFAEPPLTCGYYSYWSGLSLRADTEAYLDEEHFMLLAPTNDDLTLIYMAWPNAAFAHVRKNLLDCVRETLTLSRSVEERASAGRLASRFFGTSDLPNFLRMPHGAGWALVGDAGCHKDPLLTQGISDAFRDAESLADAVNAALRGRRSFDEALSAYQSARDAVSLDALAHDLELARLAPTGGTRRELASGGASSAVAERFCDAFFGTRRARPAEHEAARS